MKATLRTVYNALKYANKIQTQTDFGDKLGWKKSFTSTMLAKPAISEDVKTKLCSVFGVSRAWLDSEGEIGQDPFAEYATDGGHTKTTDGSLNSNTRKTEGDIDMNLLQSLIAAQQDCASAMKDQAAAAKDQARANLILTELLQSRFVEDGAAKKASGR